MAPTKTLETSQSTRQPLQQHIYEDPDALLDSGGVQADVRPAPQPRRKKVQFSDAIDSSSQVNVANVNQAVNPIKPESLDLPPTFKPPQPYRSALKPPVASKKTPTGDDRSRPATPGSPAEPQPLSADIKPPVPAKRKNAPSSYDTPAKSQTSQPQSVSYDKIPMVTPKQRSPSSSSSSSSAQCYETPSSAKSQPSESQPLSSEQKPPIPQKRQNCSSSSSSSTPSVVINQTPERYSELPQQPKRLSVSSNGALEERPVSPTLSGNSQDSRGADRTNLKPDLPQKQRNPSSSPSSYQTPTNYLVLPQQHKRLSVSSNGALEERPVSPALSGNSQDSSGTNPLVSGRLTPVPHIRQLSFSSSDLYNDRPSAAQNHTPETQPLIPVRPAPVPRNRQLSSSSSNLYYDTPSTAQNPTPELKPDLPQKQRNPSSSPSSYQTPTNYLVLPQQHKRLSVSSNGALEERPVSPARSGNSQDSSGTNSGSEYYNESRPPYIRVIPDNPNDKTLTRPELHPQLHPTFEVDNRDSIYALNTDDITALLKWLKRVSSQSDDVISPIYGLGLEEEIRSFEQKAINLRKARRLFHLLMMKRKESLENGIKNFQAVCVQLEKVKKTNKAMGIAGGTTGALGGVAAVVGIALAPVTMGTSLIVTAVGAGVAASAGGFGAHALKTNKKIVNRSTMEELVNNYKSDVVDLERCLAFIFSAMKELQRYNISRLQTAHPDAVRMAELSQLVFKNSMNTDGGISLLQLGGMTSENLLKAFSTEIDLYFTEKKGQKLKKSDKSKFSGTVANLIKNLQAQLDHLIKMWESLC
uniref:Uncharacterized protein n=1 Tax=Oryzias melastigma TaxID=30732 RepID=A0A3B3BD49_ORYME